MKVLIAIKSNRYCYPYIHFVFTKLFFSLSPSWPLFPLYLFFLSNFRDANHECNKMKKKLEESITQRRTLEVENAKKDKHILEISSRLKHSDENARKQVDQVIRVLFTSSRRNTPPPPWYFRRVDPTCLNVFLKLSAQERTMH